MPVYEHACSASTCVRYAMVTENYFSRSTAEMPQCAACGNREVKLISNFGVVFTGPLTAKYNERGSENPHQEGHWAFKKNTKDGIPKPVWISDFDAQRRFCKEEGLVNPKDIPTHAEVSDDGKKLNSRGMPGCWQ